MAHNQHVTQQIGQAWGNHRSGQNDVAITEFEQVLSIAPDSIDAFYGLGLAQRASGQIDQSIKSFQKALKITKESLQATQKLAEAKGTIVGSINDLGSTDDDRYMMLRRMITQRLVELGATGDEDLPSLP